MIRVEFYGVPRTRAGVDHLVMERVDQPRTLGQLLAWAAGHLPELGKEDWLQREFGRSIAANVNGERFIRDLDEPLRDGDCLLILSADAGG